MNYKVLEAHESDNAISIEIKCGQRVTLGERSNGSGKWPNWIYCWTLDGTSEGWTPIQILKIENETGLAIEDYSAKELTITAGEIVNGDRVLNGWIWCSRLDGSERGWLPAEKLVEI